MSQRTEKINIQEIRPDSLRSDNTVQQNQTPVNSVYGDKVLGVGDDANFTIKQKYSKADIDARVRRYCIDNDIPYELFKKLDVLKQISQYSIDELTNLEKSEVDKIFAALDEATGGLWGDWSFGERDADDLNNIIYKAKKNYLTGKQTFGEKLGTALGLNKNLENCIRKELGLKRNQPIIDAHVENYVEIIETRLRSASSDAERKAIKEQLYKDLREALADKNISNEVKSKFPKLGHLLDELCNEADHLTMVAVSGDKKAQSKTGLNIIENTIEKRSENQKISEESLEQSGKIAYEYLDDADMELAEDIITKAYEENPENRAIVPVTSGAALGIAENKVIENKPETYIKDLLELAKKYGKQDAIYERIENNLEKNPELTDENKENILEILNKATEGEYSKTVSNQKNSTEEVKTTTKEVSEVKAETTTVAKTQPKQTEASKAVVNENNKQQESQVRNSNENNDLGFKQKELPPQKEKPVAEKSEEKRTFEEVIRTGNQKEIEEYTQKNNISKVDLTVAVLNSKNASKNLVDKAVERYTRMAASLQKLYFARISSVESVTKIAENMDTNILEKVSGTGYAAKQRLEKIKEDRKEIYV